MFRPMRRFRQQLPESDCLRLLTELPRGVLSVLGEDGYPYGMPMNHWYDAETGNLYFHGAKAGHRMDALRACDKVSYCVFDQGYRKDGEWSLNIRSVVVFGRMRPVTDTELSRRVCREISLKFTDDEAYIQHELEHAFPAVLCWELIPEHISGKLVNES